LPSKATNVPASLIISNKGETLNPDHNIQEKINEYLEVITLLKNDSEFSTNLSKISDVITECFKAGGKLLICGNGGSAADSQHLATELVSRFFMERKALNAEALTVNTSTLTAVANDYSFDEVFSRQIEAKGKKGDVLLSISTSGNSKNVIEAIKVAKSIGMKTIGFTGNNRESLICKLSDYCICVPSNSTPRIQEAHILIGHIICEIVEKEQNS
jgi:D-sedoheptulose 7-phosphate isomerase